MAALWLDTSTHEKEAFDLTLEAVQACIITVYSSSKFSVVEINVNYHEAA